MITIVTVQMVPMSRALLPAATVCFSVKTSDSNHISYHPSK